MTMSVEGSPTNPEVVFDSKKIPTLSQSPGGGEDSLARIACLFSQAHTAKHFTEVPRFSEARQGFLISHIIYFCGCLTPGTTQI